jgi:SAM-dependent methyltransferase
MPRTDPIDRRHLRFSEQAAWTAALRRRLLARLPSDEGSSVLEVGAGTGAVTAELAADRPPGRVVALDIDMIACRFGAAFVPRPPGAAETLTSSHFRHRVSTPRSSTSC